jgi:hypothetical protein
MLAGTLAGLYPWFYASYFTSFLVFLGVGALMYVIAPAVWHDER